MFFWCQSIVFVCLLISITAAFRIPVWCLILDSLVGLIMTDHSRSDGYLTVISAGQGSVFCAPFTYIKNWRINKERKKMQQNCKRQTASSSGKKIPPKCCPYLHVMVRPWVVWKHWQWVFILFIQWLKKVLTRGVSIQAMTTESRLRNGLRWRYSYLIWWLAWRNSPVFHSVSE